MSMLPGSETKRSNLVYYLMLRCIKMHFKSLEICPCNEALLENTGNYWTDMCSGNRTFVPALLSQPII